MDPLLIISLILGLIVFGFTIYLLWHKDNPTFEKKNKGKNHARNSSEERAVSVMRRFAGSNRFRFIAPARLQRGDNTAELAAVCVGYFGVLGVITLGYNGDIYGGADDKMWTRVAPNGERTTFTNPIFEASAAVRVLRDVLMSKKLKRVPVEVVYVFTDDKAQLALPRSIAPMKVKDFKKLLGKEKYLEDTGLDLDEVENALREALAQ